MNRIFQVCVIALVSVVWAGCASTTMRTARQLEPGDVVLSGSLDELGTLYIPRVNAQAIYGFGAGDVSAHVGTSLLLYNLGVGGRFYLGEDWNLGLQYDANGFQDLDLFGSTTGLTVLHSGSVTLLSSVSRDTGFYGGLYSGVHGLTQDEATEFAGVNVGGTVGLDALIGNNWGVQLEARFAPFMVTSSGSLTLFPGSLVSSNNTEEAASNTIFVGQIGFGVYKRLKTRERIPASESAWMTSSEESFERARQQGQQVDEPTNEQEAPVKQERKRTAPSSGGAPAPPMPD